MQFNLNCKRSNLKSGFKRRQERRSQLRSSVLRDELERVELTKDGLIELLLAIEGNATSYFGIERLSKLALNRTYSKEMIKSCVERNDGRFPQNRLIWNFVNGPVCLLDIASIFNRDTVIASLVRSGAMFPIQCGDDSSACEVDERLVFSYISKLPQPVVVWVVKVISYLRLSFNKRNLESTTKGLETDENVEKRASSEDLRCSNPNCSHSSRTIWSMTPCSHSCCELCFFNSLQTQPVVANLYSDDIRCPICQEYIIPESGKSEFDVEFSYKFRMDHNYNNKSNNNSIHVSSNSNSNSNSNSSNSDIGGGESMSEMQRIYLSSKANNYDNLNAEFDFDKSSRPAFCALSMNDYVFELVGNTKAKRVFELFKAVNVGFYLRVKALIYTGVDLNTKNEYGQTGLFIAGWKGFTDLALLLIDCGCDPLILDNCQVGFLDVILFQRHFELYLKICEKYPLLIRDYINSKSKLWQSIESSLRATNNDSITFSYASIAASPELICTNRDYFHLFLNEYDRSSSILISSQDRDFIAKTYLMPTPIPESKAESTPNSSEVTAFTSQLSVLIPFESDHPGAGSFIIDNAFDDNFLEKLLRLSEHIPIAIPEKNCSSDRSYYCDVTRGVSSVLERVVLEHISKYFVEADRAVERKCSIVSVSDADLIVEKLNKVAISSESCRDDGEDDESSDDDFEDEVFGERKVKVHFYSHMRYLFYRTIGGSLVAHVDLSRTDELSKLTSTHTFILYLATCGGGGETLLLRNLKGIDGREANSPANVLCRVAPKKGRLLLFPHQCPHAGAEVTEVPKTLIRGEVRVQI